MTQPMPRVFIVEDEAFILLELSDRLSSLGYEVCGTEASGEEAFDAIVAAAPDLLLLDIRLAGRLSGIELAALVNARVATAVVFLTAYSDSEFVEQAGELEAFGYLVKPFDDRSLHATLQTALYKHKLQQALRATNEQLELRIRERTATLDTLRRLYERFVAHGESEAIWHELVREAARSKKADRAFVGEFVVRDDGSPQFRTDAVVGFAWQLSHPAVQDAPAEHVMSADLRALVDRVVFGRVPVVGDLLVQDLGTPDAPAPAVRTVPFLAIPVLADDILLGIIGVEWHSLDEGPATSPRLAPVLSTHAALLHARRIERQRRAAENELRLLNADLEAEIRRRSSALVESERIYVDLAENMGDGLILDDVDGRLQYANRRFRDWFGLGDGPLDGLVLEDHVAPEWRAPLRDRHARRVRGESVPDQFEYEGLDARGERIWLSVHVSPVREQGRIVGTQSVLREVSESKQIEQTLRLLSVELASLEGRTLYDRLLARLSEVLGADAAFIIRTADADWNPLAWAIEGRAVADDLLPQFDAVSGAMLLHNGCFIVAAGAASRVAKCPLTLKFAAEALATIPLSGHDGTQLGHLGVLSRRRFGRPERVESVLHLVAVVLAGTIERERQTRLLYDLMEFAPDAMVISDADGKITRINAQAEKVFGWRRQELVGRSMEVLVPPEYRAQHPKLRKQFVRSPHARPMGVRNASLAAVRRNGETFPAEISLSPLATEGGVMVAAAIRDITERRSLEQIASRRQRLDAIGTLAGGIAHDLNNSLGPILMAVELLRIDHPGSAEVLDTLEQSAQRASGMVRQLLTFAKGTAGDREAVQLPVLVSEVEKIVASTFPKNIRFVKRIADDVPAALGDITQVHQVLLNLVVNARDAMPEGGSISVELTAETVGPDDAVLERTADGGIGDFVVLRVRDTGAGIPPEIADKIFDPFFTTKDPDKGTGLGLSTVLGIVKGHGGFVLVDSEPRHGTTFSIYLPALAEHHVVTAPESTPERFQGRGEIVLYVDDEAALRDVAREVLSRLNISPLTASDGTDGLLQAAQHREDIRAIITDLHMPHMDGVVFVRAVRKILPRVPIIVASGRISDHGRAELEALGVRWFISKPFTQRQLEEALGEAFASGRD